MGQLGLGYANARSIFNGKNKRTSVGISFRAKAWIQDLYALLRMRLAKKAAAVMAYLSSRALMQQVFWKKQITQAKKLFETTKQAPSPSKDYVHVLVTEGGVVVRRFPITLRGVTQGAVPCPTEKIVTLEEFQIDVDLQSEIGRTFGSEILTQVKSFYI